MKKLLLILLLSTSLYSQTISVKGVTLEYTSQNHRLRTPQLTPQQKTDGSKEWFQSLYSN